MRRREFLPVFAAIAVRFALAQAPSKAARRGVYVPTWDGMPSRAELLARGLEVFDRPRKALLLPVTPAFVRDKTRRSIAFAARPLEADCFRALSNGVGPEVEVTPENLAATTAIFKRLAELDPWMEEATPIVDMALVGGTREIERSLLELHEQFEIIGRDSDYSAYRLLILPDPKRADPKKLAAYRKFGGSIYTPPPNITREAFAEALRKYVPKPAVIAPGLPAEAEVTFLERRTPGGIRRVGHVLYYPNDKPGVLENVQLSFRLPQHPLGVITIPDQRPVEFVHNEFLTTFTLPKVTGHQAIAFE